MRRFLASFAGKVVSHLAVVSLLVPTLALGFVNRSEAQVQFQPTWAVTQFATHNGLDPNYGVAAASAINTELARTSRYTMISPETVSKQITTLGLAAPLVTQENLLRVGQELRAATIVSGDVIAARIVNVGGGKQAKVALRAVAYNVASGLPVNGSAVIGTSTTRSGADATDETLIRDAIRAGANQAIRDFQQHQLPTATVLNTLVDRCYINQGTRSGFTNGQSVVLTRDRLQVATGHIAELEPDEAAVIIEHSSVGVAPGDHVHATYAIPDISFDNPFNRPGTGLEVHRHSNNVGNNAGLISLLVVVGLVGVLLGNGGNTQNVLNSVTAQATLYNQIPGVQVSWSPSGYAKGNSQIAAWQVYRSDVFNAPVAVTQGNVRNVVDQYQAGGIDTQYTSWTYFNGVIGGSSCVNTGYDNQTAPATLASLSLGTTYTYQVELVYVLSSIDLPIVSGTGNTGGTATAGGTGTTAGGTGTTAGGTGTTSGGSGVTSSTTGGTTSTTAGGTGSTATTGGTASTGSTATTSGSVNCYFISPKQSSGPATPLPPPVLVSPGTNAIGPNTQTTFQWIGSARSQPQEINYIIQFSSSPNFSSGTVYTYPHTITSFAAGGNTGNTVTLSSPLTLFGSNGILPAAIAGASTVFYRIGARAVVDNPGPTPDPLTHQPYIFSLQPGFFTETQQNPTLPSAASKKGKKAHRRSH